MQSPAGGRRRIALAMRAGFAAPGLVGGGQALLVQHGRLEARPGAHIGADLLAAPAGQGIGGEGEQSGEEIGRQRRRAGPELAGDGGRVGEIHDPRAAGPERDPEPDRVFCRLAPDLIETERTRVALHAFVAIALDLAFEPHEKIGPDGLRAGVSAPHPAEQAGHQEQPHRGDDQGAGQQVDVLRPELKAEEVVAPRGDIEQHRLAGPADAAVPAQPGQQVIDRQAEREHRPFDAAHRSLDGLGIDPHPIGVEMLAPERLLQLAAAFLDPRHRRHAPRYSPPPSEWT